MGSIGSHWSAAAAARYLSLLTLAPIYHSLHMTELQTLGIARMSTPQRPLVDTHSIVRRSLRPAPRVMWEQAAWSSAVPVQPIDVIGETRSTAQRSACPASRPHGGAHRRHTQHHPSQLLSSPLTLWGRHAPPSIAVPVQPLDVMGERAGGTRNTVHRSSCPAPRRYGGDTQHRPLQFLSSP